MGRILYISDLHFGHRNVIGFDHRPFKTVQEMDETIIRNWQDKVRDDDHVYLLGDLEYKSGKDPRYYLEQLPGHKHLIIGNHDWRMLENKKSMAYFESADKMLRINDRDRDIVLCHYPMLDWDGMYHKTFHIYGHIHASRNDTYRVMASLRGNNSFNAAACINHYEPVTFEELVVNNLAFRENGIGGEEKTYDR